MSISDDIKKVLQEVAASCTIYKPDGTVVTGEYVDTVSHTEHTTPLIRGFFTDLTLYHPTQAEVGDVVEFEGKQVIILARAAEIFEDDIVDYLASGYTANSSGSFQDFVQDAGFDADYNKIQAWTDIYPGITIRGSMIDRLFRSNILEIGDHSFEAEQDQIHLYVSGYYDKVEMGMRWVPDTGTKFYKVEQIEEFRFPGIRLVFLSEDTRA